MTQDANGCEVCECATIDCGVNDCSIYCPNGLKKLPNGCEVCLCKVIIYFGALEYVKCSYRALKVS